ncbi:nitrite reductase small subunit NirD [Bordetella flabilis]|uniref:nitrite reductase small subunit NirD n=1 Tax=Bordetella flabilis TaxID=463014 RepID=UPI000A0742C1|nr:nitrite reductase small subunit NirD [Bordetella flabilis]
MTQADTPVLDGRRGRADARTSPGVCRVEDIPPLGTRVVRRAGAEDIALFRCRDDRIFAVIDRCPHKGGPLSAGLVHGHAVTCPLHGWTIELDSGQAQAPDVGCVQTIPVRVEDGIVHLAMEAQG